ncbi:MAG: hypothetical protein ACHQHP_06825, partial [Bacteroidia bacterium]
MKVFYAIIIFFVSSFCYGQKEIIFKKHPSSIEFSMPLPYLCTIKLIDGKKQTCVIFGQNDTSISCKIKI